MSKATKRKHVVKEMEDSYSIPTEYQSIVRLTEPRGNNLHEVVDSAGEQYLVSMPVKFRRNIWVKRGDFVLVEPIAEGDKVKAEIVKILTREHQKWYRAQNCWPKEFDKTEQSKQKTTKNITEENDSETDDIYLNTNRLKFNRSRNVSETSSDESNCD